MNNIDEDEVLLEEEEVWEGLIDSKRGKTAQQHVINEHPTYLLPAIIDTCPGSYWRAEGDEAWLGVSFQRNADLVRERHSDLEEMRGPTRPVLVICRTGLVVGGGGDNLTGRVKDRLRHVAMLQKPLGEPDWRVAMPRDSESAPLIQAPLSKYKSSVEPNAETQQDLKRRPARVALLEFKYGYGVMTHANLIHGSLCVMASSNTTQMRSTCGALEANKKPPPCYRTSGHAAEAGRGEDIWIQPGVPQCTPKHRNPDGYDIPSAYRHIPRRVGMVILEDNLGSEPASRPRRTKSAAAHARLIKRTGARGQVICRSFFFSPFPWARSPVPRQNEDKTPVLRAHVPVHVLMNNSSSSRNLVRSIYARSSDDCPSALEPRHIQGQRNQTFLRLFMIRGRAMIVVSRFAKSGGQCYQLAAIHSILQLQLAISLLGEDRTAGNPQPLPFGRSRGTPVVARSGLKVSSVIVITKIPGGCQGKRRTTALETEDLQITNGAVEKHLLELHACGVLPSVTRHEDCIMFVWSNCFGCAPLVFPKFLMKSPLKGNRRDFWPSSLYPPGLPSRISPTRARRKLFRADPHPYHQANIHQSIHHDETYYASSAAQLNPKYSQLHGSDRRFFLKTAEGTNSPTSPPPINSFGGHSSTTPPQCSNVFCPLTATLSSTLPSTHDSCFFPSRCARELNIPTVKIRIP
ncbi:uncharacterized protein BDR25DRAFT_348331 [Lindgomyces ingoldianus]|uniref:Uncharacterized protein n=1 Tax=Lindgomyces ingoldianus TaxID=673940 RepID=A0ACB6RFI0_9PLEO|nr:uncharacterized protein BDR25DRAFT_348331 [Lindgomyces ingoldianus]KAF2478048.1 hypothetical protein BDR25DRAFT_348331 [Lindgomyces ingoldianus]